MTEHERIAIRHAALSGPFDPERFLYHVKTPSQRDEVLRALAPRCKEVLDKGQSRWLMHNADRTQQLRALAGDPVNRRRLWRKRAPLAGDVFAQVLRAALEGEALSPLKYDLDEIGAAISATIFALPHVPAPLAAPLKTFEKELYRRSVVLSHANRVHTVLPHKLCGRVDETKAMQAFMRNGEVHAPLQRLSDEVNLTSANRVIITGSPGMGKSAFLANLTQWAETRRSTWPHWLVQLDFDQIMLTHGSVVAWAEEVTRQIGNQEPGIASALSDIRRKQATKRRSLEEIEPVSNAAEMLTETWSVLSRRPPRDLIILADTIEEITAVDPTERFKNRPDDTSFRQLLSWFDWVKDNSDESIFSAVRLVAAGRTAPPVTPEVLSDWFDASYELDVLGTEAAGEMICQRDGRISAEEASEIVEAIGGHPLHIILVQKYLDTLLPKERRPAITELAREGLKGAGARFITRALYSRFLGRFRAHNLPDGLTVDMLREIAHPGLLLREITPLLLREVVCPAVGVTLPDDSLVKSALSALREQVWLVTPGHTPGAVRHRADVRRVMVPLMLHPEAEDAEKARTVLERAIQWHTSQNTRQDDVEAGYLNALRGNAAPFVGEESLANSVYSEARADLEILPIACRAILKYYASSRPPLDTAERAALPQDLSRSADIRQKSRAAQQIGGDAPGSHAKTIELGQPELGAPESRWQDNLDWIPESKNAYDLLDSTEIHDAIQIAFYEADFATVSHIGWTAISRILRWPNLMRELSQRRAFGESWLWRTALASTLYPPPVSAMANLTLEIERHINHINQVTETTESPTQSFFDIDSLLSLALPDRPFATPGSLRRKDDLFLIGLRARRVMASSSLMRAALSNHDSSIFLGFHPTAAPWLSRLFAPGNEPLSLSEIDPKAPPVFPVKSSVTKLPQSLLIEGIELLGDGVQHVVERFAHSIETYATHRPGGDPDPDLSLAGLLLQSIWTLSGEDREQAMDYIISTIAIAQPNTETQALCQINLHELHRNDEGAALKFRGQTPELHHVIAIQLSRLSAINLMKINSYLRQHVVLWPAAMEAKLVAASKMKGRAALAASTNLVQYADLSGLLLQLCEFVLGMSPEVDDMLHIADLLRELDKRWSLPQAAS